MVRRGIGNHISTRRLRVGLGEDEIKSLSMFGNISKEKASSNAQANWIFTLDKRPQMSLTDQWLQANLGKFAGLSGQPCFVTSDIGHVGNL